MDFILEVILSKKGYPEKKGEALQETSP